MHSKESKMSAFRNIIAEQDEESSSFQNSVGEKTTTTAIGKVSKFLSSLKLIHCLKRQVVADSLMRISLHLL